MPTILSLFEIGVSLLILPVLSAFAAAAPVADPSSRRPNVVVVLTDDQGYGDLGCHGHPFLKTPHLDKLHAESVRFTDFHAAPICTPTRSQLLTGRDALANGAYCVCSGHGFIASGVPTMADVFAASGYRVGHFGKWHLGDNYPYRPQDRGFHETLACGGWGFTSSPDYWGNSCMDPWLRRNGGPWRQYPGYCTDVFFSEAMKWMNQCAGRGEPFFVYLPTNVPHTPHQIPKCYAQPYDGNRFFGMIANLDENMGRLDIFLKSEKLFDDTLVVFITDNGGTAGVRVFNAGMRGRKGSYYEGGHRVPCFVRWPAGRFRPPGDVDLLAQTQDVLPTLIDLCGLTREPGCHFDGVSLAPLLRGLSQPKLDDRILVVQCAVWSEYEKPVKDSAAVLWRKWRLVHGNELYDLQNDPGQKKNIAADHSEVVARLRAHYGGWWRRVEPLARRFQPIHLGSERELATALNSCDWVAPNTSNQITIREGAARNGPWYVYVERPGAYRIELRRWPAEADLPIAAAAPPLRSQLGRFPPGKALPIVKARLKVAGVVEERIVSAEDRAAAFEVSLPAGRATLQTWFFDAEGRELSGAYFVYVSRGGSDVPRS